MIDVYVTHYVTDALAGYTDLVVEQVNWIREITDGPDYRLTVIFWTDSDACERDLRARMPSWVSLVRSDRGPRPDAQPALMNKATDLAKAAGSEVFVQLHNDARVSRGWLRRLVDDVRAGEARYGRGRVIVSPRYIPWHWVDPPPSAYLDASFWNRIRPPAEAKVLSAAAMAAWCRQYGFVFDGRAVESLATAAPTDHGHQLMMYAAAPEFFDTVGPCDESFVGVNYGDCDWGIRAMQAGKKNLQSQGCLIGHISGLTLFNPKCPGSQESNADRFIAKWGPALFAEMQTGALWLRLRREQGA